VIKDSLSSNGFLGVFALAFGLVASFFVARYALDVKEQRSQRGTQANVVPSSDGFAALRSADDAKDAPSEPVHASEDRIKKV
jgi:hypothetical protein